MNTQIQSRISSSPSVFIHDGKAITTSISIADYFQKTHDNVLKKIRSVIADCDEKYHLVNFNEVVRDVTGGDGAVRKMPMYELTRDGFVLIAMGFTGKKALQWKINYINAFNSMEAELFSPKKSTVDQRTPLRDAVNLLVSKKGLMYPEAYSIVHQRFSVESIEELQPEQLPMAIEYIHRLALEGEYLPKDDPREVTHLYVNKDLDIHNVNALAKHFEAIYTAWKVELYPALRSVDSPIASRLYDRFKDGYSFLMRLQESLNGKHPALIN
ncbi:Rha family transcriptional regulator [Morganella morganii]|uniref:Rha family transcriptional regulator n=1 Tax=Morganella morganii TaxID=582 RepID=UPI00066274C2|nr:Rha family transcriptional regulator [Morganella morganii]MBV7311058.1 Rha family transcriptional regulator [Morganella morganii]